MIIQNPQKRERQYFIDWLRIALIISVFFFHVGMIFRPEHWHVNSTVTFSILDPIMSWLHIWRMPLLFLVSGVGTYYALGKRTSWQYVKERVKRLYVPFSIGIFTLVPVQVYIEKIDSFSSLVDFYFHMFDGIYPDGNFSWHHLWFIAYLFLISLFISPFLSFTRTDWFKKIREKLIVLVSKPFGMNWLLILIIGSQCYLRNYWPNSTHALFNDWAYFVFYMVFFLIGFVLFTSEKAVNTMANQRRMYLAQTALFTTLLFSMWLIDLPETFGRYAYWITEMTVSLTCGLTAIGYFKRYFNRDHRWRSILNEAIYPFYLLHQTVLVVIGYFVLNLTSSPFIQLVLITTISLISIISVYWFIIRKFNVLRVAFGLKVKQSRTPRQELKLEPALAPDR